MLVLRQVKTGVSARDMKCIVIIWKVISLNPGWVELGVRSTSF